MSFNDKNHKFGRIFLAIAIGLIVLVPIIISIVLNVQPEYLVILKSLPSLIVFFAGGFVEVITYAPMLGTTGTYVAFFTGNLVNLKVPCAVNARDLLDSETTQEEKEIVSTVSIATSTIVTTLVLGIGVLLLTPLTPVFEAPVLQPAYSTVFTALFGALAYKYFTRDFRLVPIPLVLCTVLQIFLNLGTSILVPLAVLITILFSYYLFKLEGKRIDKAL